MRPHSAVASRLPSALRFLVSCNSMNIDDIILHFERHIGGLLPPTQLRAAVTRLVKDAVRAGTLILRNRRYAVSTTWLPSSTLTAPHRCSLCDLAKPLPPARPRRRPAQRRGKSDNRRLQQQHEQQDLEQQQQQQAPPMDELWVRGQDQPDALDADHDAEGDFSTISSNDAHDKDSLNTISPEPSSTTGQKSQ